MSPEQAKGRRADKRSDVWSFGCVIYEMLTGTRAFAGDDPSDVLASVLAREPDWTRLPSGLAPGLGPYIRRCLHKNPKERVADVQDVRLALDGAFETGTSSPANVARQMRTRRIATIAASALIVAVGFAAVWLTGRSDETVAPQISRLQIAPPDSAAMMVSVDSRTLAITPDGARLVYVGDAGRQLFVRAMDTIEPTSVYTGAPRGPFVSPDGQWIGFIDNRELKKIPIGGGPPVTIATLDAPTYRGAAWGPDDTIVFATTNPETGLQRVSAQGGPITILTRQDHERGEADHVWPEWLDGQSVIFTISPVAGGPEKAQMAILNLRTGSRTALPRGGTPVQYVSTGHLVYATHGTLWALPFDPARPEAPSTPVAVVRDVVTSRLRPRRCRSGAKRDARVRRRQPDHAIDAHARLGGSAGSRDGNSRPVACLRAPSAITGWNACSGLRCRSAARPLAVGSEAVNVDSPHDWCRCRHISRVDT